MVEPIFDYQFRLILIGDSTVGKSSLLKYFTEGRYDEMCDPTVGVDFYARLIEVKPGVKVKLQLWDTAGQERFRSITKSYYRNSVGILLVYDITNRRSFEHLESWLSEAQLHIDSRRAVYIIVGHKADRDSERAITTREGRNFAQFHGARYLETSAKTGQNIEEVFLTITRDIYEMLECGHLYVEDGWDGIKAGYAHPRDCFTVTPEEQSSSGGCC